MWGVYSLLWDTVHLFSLDWDILNDSIKCTRLTPNSKLLAASAGSKHILLLTDLCFFFFFYKSGILLLQLWLEFQLAHHDKCIPLIINTTESKQ